MSNLSLESLLRILKYLGVSQTIALLLDFESKYFDGFFRRGHQMMEIYDLLFNPTKLIDLVPENFVWTKNVNFVGVLNSKTGRKVSGGQTINLNF